MAFSSFANNLVAGDTNGVIDVFVHNRVTGATERANVDSAGGQANASGSGASISGDGRLVAFASDATNLVAGDMNGRRDVFVHDMATGTTERVSVDCAGTEADGHSVGPGISGGTAFGPSISADGRFVAFDSIATNLIAGDTNACELRGHYFFLDPGTCPDVFVHDRQTGATVRVSVDSAGAQANDPSTDAAINGDGSVTAFFSVASNLVAGDTNTCPVFPNPGQCAGIFVHDGE